MKRTPRTGTPKVFAARTTLWLIALMAWFIPTISIAQGNGYFIQLSDKKESPYTLENPQAFLSDRAIERRVRQQIPFDQEDLPVSPSYIAGIEACGAKVKHASKWLNGVILFCDDAVVLDRIKALSYVIAIEKTKEIPGTESAAIIKTLPLTEANKSSATANQIEMVRGNYLHQKGYTGQGIHIAVLDAGFRDVDKLEVFSHLFKQNRVLGTKDFVADGTPFYDTDTHGLHVFSIMAGKIDGQFEGSAPDASYYLFRTEDMASEYPVEADYWVCAAELADSLGVDIIQSSLGYYYFNNPEMNYTHQQLDGSTRISKAASIAAKKGMIVVNSAGNEANNDWRYVIMPADSPHILTIGAVSSNGTRGTFSSVGYQAYNIIKPDVMALGLGTSIITTGNRITLGNGTSYACPLISGLTACIWQAKPQKKADEIIQIIRKSAHMWLTPDYQYGYGLPDFNKALQLATGTQSAQAQAWIIHPNPFKTHFTIVCPELDEPATISIYAITGLKLWEGKFQPSSEIRISPDVNISPGIYILSIETNKFAWSRKIHKQ